MKPLRIFLIGASGQLGQALCALCPDQLNQRPIELIAPSRTDLDLSDPGACSDAVRQHRPDWLLNAAAYTEVDKAESERDLAYAVNAGAPRVFAEVLKDIGGRMLQLSTDFVFDGSQGWPYATDQQQNPLGVYGASKAAGEQAVMELLGPSERGTILRTSWLLGPVGRNFLLTMLRLHDERDELCVVADQVGCPTSTLTLSSTCWRTIECWEQGQHLPGVMHWSDAGAASWYDVAVAIGELGQELGLLHSPALVQPITTAEYLTPVRRPTYSLLDCTETWRLLELQPLHWRRALAAVLHEVQRLRSAESLAS